ncbi:dimethyladenosine transferase [Malonomonas rubra DSM 5091]|uniref:Ribosomal RNA small subunit methyltransferase A n=1 Tax=Malonomonas rubra DSM 5091 TaxID=1122189 RepID=A0A1M6B2L3_MALRU|nr:16S rRNA (adenine(1518)-N(6)/adenine(1519)-N(6))-dimethyltransferase RsmA [Malonomonas rubra]SHI42955.1 dimethyladenosine transferase [Malonomonas rubra DSM 5091]
MKQGGYKTKKRFGQHFLHDQSVIDKILAAAELSADQEVVEIGPGLGVLTDRLLPETAHVHVMEIDRDLIELLQARQDSRLSVHAGDVLKTDWTASLPQPPYVLVANLPYNISSQIVFKLLEHRPLFTRMVLMFQREVGERLVASPGGKDYGILSVLCQLWYDISVVSLVKPGAFNPPPKVDSIVLKFVPLAHPRVDPINEAMFQQVVKAAFTQRRKTLRNSLQAAGFEPELVAEMLASTQIDPTRRGETLQLQEFSDLTRVFCAGKS